MTDEDWTTLLDCIHSELSAVDDRFSDVKAGIYALQEAASKDRTKLLDKLELFAERFSEKAFNFNELIAGAIGMEEDL